MEDASLPAHEAQIARVLVAPDKFRGTLTATEATEILASSFEQVGPGVVVTRHPVADGGEGTVELALAAGFTAATVHVTDPMGWVVEAKYAIDGKGTAVLELAQAAGLGLLRARPTTRTASASTTRGVGEMLLDSFDRGVTRVVLGVGGSASTDGGAGFLQALGVRILDAAGNDVPPGGIGLNSAATVDFSGLDPRLADIELVIACDVDNPLTGPEGAAFMYGRQKGANTGMLAKLDQSLEHWADLVGAELGRDPRLVPGAGAAGGTAFAALAVGAQLSSGVAILAELSGLSQLIEDADLVVIGEGSLDAQSLRGKGPIGIATLARSHGVPVVAVVGRTTLDEEQIRAAGISRVYALGAFEARPEVCMSEAPRVLRLAARQAAADWYSRQTEPPRS